MVDNCFAYEDHEASFYAGRSNVSKMFSDCGRDAVELEEMITDNSPMTEFLTNELPYLKVRCVWTIRRELARIVEDILPSELSLDGPQRERQLKYFYRLTLSVSKH